jgi:uncharacterized membrane protein
MILSNPLSDKQQKLVAGEIRKWMDAGIVNGVTGETLLARYPGDANKTSVSEVLTLIGSILVGLGTILFIAANWSAITIGVKLIIIIAAIALAHFGGWKLRFEPGKRPRLGTALLVLGSLFYGAAIWLIAQIFNIEGNFSDGVLFWAIGTSAVTLASGIMPLGCMSVILLHWWCLTSKDLWEFNRARSDLGLLPNLLAVSVVAVFMSVRMQSRAMAWVSLVAGTITVLCQMYYTAETQLLLWGLLVSAGYLWTRERVPRLTMPFLITGAVSILMGLLVSTFGSVNYRQYPINQIGVMLAATLAALGVVAWKFPKFKLEATVCIIFGIATCLLHGTQEGSSRLVSNILLLLAIAGFAYVGMTRLRSAAIVNIAIVFFVFDVIARYFDMFYSTMNRSMFFVGGGMLLMLAGTLAERGRRKLVENIDADNVNSKPTSGSSNDAAVDIEAGEREESEPQAREQQGEIDRTEDSDDN